jgi:multidrug efflux pump subunit AcrB
MNIALKPFAERRLSADQIAIELRAKLRNIPGTAVTIVNQPIIRVGARGSRSNYQYTLKGLDQNELEAVSVPAPRNAAGRDFRRGEQRS